MEKHLIDRRLEQMAKEGVEFVTNAHIGENIPAEELRKEYDVVVLAGGAEQPRDLPIPGRELKGIHFAMEFLPPQNRALRRRCPREAQTSSACGKRVVIIGGGDTGADCLGTCASAEGDIGAAIGIAAQAAGCALTEHAVAALAFAVAHRELA